MKAAKQKQAQDDVAAKEALQQAQEQHRQKNKAAEEAGLAEKQAQAHVRKLCKKAETVAAAAAARLVKGTPCPIFRVQLRQGRGIFFSGHSFHRGTAGSNSSTAGRIHGFFTRRGEKWEGRTFLAVMMSVAYTYFAGLPSMPSSSKAFGHDAEGDE